MIQEDITKVSSVIMCRNCGNEIVFLDGATINYLYKGEWQKVNILLYLDCMMEIYPRHACCAQPEYKYAD